MKKLKLGTRVLVNGVETFIAELHADIKRGVYKVRTSNPTYEFCKHSDGGFTALTCDGKVICLQEAPKYGNYQVDDEVFCTYNGVGVVERIASVKDFPVLVRFKEGSAGYTLEGKCYHSDKSAVLKKLRVKLGEER